MAAGIDPSPCAARPESCAGFFLSYFSGPEAKKNRWGRNNMCKISLTLWDVAGCTETKTKSMKKLFLPDGFRGHGVGGRFPRLRRSPRPEFEAKVVAVFPDGTVRQNSKTPPSASRDSAAGVYIAGFAADQAKRPRSVIDGGTGKVRMTAASPSNFRVVRAKDNKGRPDVDRAACSHESHAEELFRPSFGRRHFFQGRGKTRSTSCLSRPELRRKQYSVFRSAPVHGRVRRTSSRIPNNVDEKMVIRSSNVSAIDTVRTPKRNAVPLRRKGKRRTSIVGGTLCIVKASRQWLDAAHGEAVSTVLFVQRVTTLELKPQLAPPRWPLLRGRTTKNQLVHRFARHFIFIASFSRLQAQLVQAQASASAFIENIKSRLQTHGGGSPTAGVCQQSLE